MKTNWISINQDFPNSEAVYLAVFKTPCETFVETVFFFEGKFVLPCRNNTEFITHWMQMPELPTDVLNET